MEVSGMETAKQNTQQNIEENDALKQFMGLLNRQGMGEQSQDSRKHC